MDVMHVMQSVVKLNKEAVEKLHCTFTPRQPASDDNKMLLN
jgi:hypothetical protein